MNRRPAAPSAECVALFREGHWQALIQRAWRLPPPDLADVFAAMTRADRQRLLEILPPRLAARALIELPAEARPEQLLAALAPAAAAEIIGSLDDDDIADLLSTVPQPARDAILAAVEKRPAIEELLHHDAGSAGRMMTTSFICVTESDLIHLALESVRRQSVEVASVDDIYVIDVSRRLVGLLSFKALALADGNVVVRDVMEQVIERVSTADPRESVIQNLRRYHLTSIPVVDDAGRLLGRITSYDVVEIAATEAAGTLLRYAGVNPDEEFGARWPAAVKSRLPTLYVNLLTAFITAALVHAVTHGSGRLLPLLVWMPIVAGIGGNAGLQSLATTWHRLSQGRLPWNRRRAVLAKEIAVGMVNGAAIGALVGGVAILVGESLRAGLVVTLALVLQLPIAGGLAAVLPMILRRARLNPGLASAPAVSTLLDVIGLAILLLLGVLIL